MPNVVIHSVTNSMVHALLSTIDNYSASQEISLFIQNLTMLCGSLSPQDGMSSSCGWRRWPQVMEGGYKCIK